MKIRDMMEGRECEWNDESERRGERVVRGLLLTRRVLMPPMTSTPRANRPLSISIVVSLPGVMGQVAGSSWTNGGVEDDDAPSASPRGTTVWLPDTWASIAETK